MKYHDIVSIATENIDLLNVADSCYAFKKADMAMMRLVSNIVLTLDFEQKNKVMFFLATARFVSLSVLFSGLIKENSKAVHDFFDVEDSESALGRIINEKLRLFYTLKLISSTFDDENLLNLKKAFNTDE